MHASATYLDYNATAPVRPEVRAAVADALAIGGNPSSVHRFGRLARATIDRARDRVAGLVGAPASQVTFTSGGTEANAIGVRTLVAMGAKALLISGIEHASIRGAARVAGVPVREIPVAGDGTIDLTALAVLLADGGPYGVAVMLANNETGAIQPVAEAARLVHAAGGWLLCDAVQGAGRIPVEIASLGADLLTLSAHKLGGATGVGALVAADHMKVAPLLVGGGQESGARAGTENVAGIAGFGAAADLARPEPSTLRDQLELRLRAAHADVEIFAADVARVPNTACFAVPGISAETAVIALDLAGIAVSAGAACSSGKVGPSHVLRAMGVSDATARCAMRVSFGWNSAAGDVDRFMTAWADVAARLGFRSNNLYHSEPALRRQVG